MQSRNILKSSQWQDAYLWNFWLCDAQSLMPKISFGWFGCAVDHSCHGRPLKAGCSKGKYVFTTLISRDLEKIGPWGVQSAKNLSLLEKILYFSLLFLFFWSISIHEQKLHPICFDVWQVNAFHALYFPLCILLAWYIFLHHGRLDTGKGNKTGSPMPAAGNWAPTCQF